MGRRYLDLVCGGRCCSCWVSADDFALIFVSSSCRSVRSRVVTLSRKVKRLEEGHFLEVHLDYLKSDQVPELLRRYFLWWRALLSACHCCRVYSFCCLVKGFYNNQAAFGRLTRICGSAAALSMPAGCYDDQPS